MSYGAGVLIHNFNEDRFGAELLQLPKTSDPPMVSVSHAVHGWKQADLQGQAQPMEATATQSVDKHILFGHAGDMRDPHTNLQKSEFMTSNNYFMRDPKEIPGVGTLTADAFTMGDAKVAAPESRIAAGRRKGWGDGSRAHALPPDERFKSTYMASTSTGGVAAGQRQLGDHYYPRPTSDTTSAFNKVQVTRGAIGQNKSLRSACAVALKK